MGAQQTPLIPAKAGIQKIQKQVHRLSLWVPAFAGATAPNFPHRHNLAVI
jgi:hypothetical protein